MSDDSITDAIRKILLNDWDPNDLSRNEHAHHGYDALIPSLWELIRSSADEQTMVDFLRERELESMCFPSLDTRRLRPVARKLLALRDARPV